MHDWQPNNVNLLGFIVVDWGMQQSTAESNPKSDGQLSAPHIRPALHSFDWSQSPSSSPQG